jgi:hypothetical protein
VNGRFHRNVYTYLYLYRSAYAISQCTIRLLMDPFDYLTTVFSTTNFTARDIKDFYLIKHTSWRSKRNWRYSFMYSYPLAIGGMSAQLQVPAALPQGENPSVSIVYNGGRAPEPLATHSRNITKFPWFSGLGLIHCRLLSDAETNVTCKPKFISWPPNETSKPNFDGKKS